MASFSGPDPLINHTQYDDSQTSFHSMATHRQTMNSINLSQTPPPPQTTIDVPNTQSNDDEEDQLLISHYELNKRKQEKLLGFMNIFRFLIILILAPIIYFVA